MNQSLSFIREHIELTRRCFLGMGAAGVLALRYSAAFAADKPVNAVSDEAFQRLGEFLTRPEKFRDVSRGKPLPHALPDDQKAAVGLTRETWALDILSDPDHPSKLGKPLLRESGTALDFAALLELGQSRAVKFAKLMTCLNIGCPLGMGIWEGVPLREIIWLTQPRENLRRVFYYGYHNDDPKQMFRSSLPIGRVLEDPYDLPPVIVCYKLNGQFLSSERGGPVRIVVPEAYGFKSIKWLSHIVLTNLASANDTYIDGNNDVDSPLKSFAATLVVPRENPAETPIAVSGYAQVGQAGVSKVQVWLASDNTVWPEDDPHFLKAPWRDAKLVRPPTNWGGGFDDGKLPGGIHGFDDATGEPRDWPIRYGLVHWAAALPGVPAGNYTLRCRTVDEKGIAQPLPRPFRKSGHAAIEQVSLQVTQ